MLRHLAAVVGQITNHGHFVVACDHSVTTFELGQLELAVRFEETLGLKGRIEFHGFENYLPTCGEAGTVAVGNLTAHRKSRLRIAAADNATEAKE
jgi:hypothetical protein